MRRLMLLTCVSGYALTLPMAAQAQTERASSVAVDSEADASSGVGEIIVTANKRSENQQKVPITITAFTGETLKAQGVTSVNDLPSITPGLTLTHTIAGANSFLRGVGTTTAGYTTEAPVAVYLDGIYIPNPAAAAFSFNNIERIEVLKGPQGTLYGRNSTGGLIHVITRDPGREAHVDASVGYGNYNTTKIDFYGSVPIGDTLAANVSATYTDQAKGWGRNVFLNTEAYKFKDFGIQGKLRWTPDALTTVTLQGFYDRTSSDMNTYSIYPGSFAPDGTSYLGEYRVAAREAPFVKQRQALGSLKVEHDFGFATLRTISAYLNNESPSRTPGAYLGSLTPGRGTTTLAALQKAETYSQEINLSSNASDSPLQWITGLFYYHDDTAVQADVYGTCIDLVCNPGPPVPNRTTGYQFTRSYSAFGEATYSVTPTTRLTLGLRYTSDKKTLDGTLIALQGRPNSIPALPPTTITDPDQAIDTSKTFNKLTWKAVLAQDFSPDIHGFASYSRGFKSGGYNLTTFTNPASFPETLDAFEVGVKSELLDRALRFNVSAFYYNYRDIQLRSSAPPAPPGLSILFNAAAAHIKGIDVDMVLAPAEGLAINAGLEVLDAKYTDFPGGLCSSPRAVTATVLGGTATAPCNLAGSTLPDAPKFSYNLGITYAVQTGIGELEFNASDNYKSTFYWESDNRLKQGSYHLVNASITWSLPDSGFSLRAYARNLFDEYYFTAAAVTLSADAYSPGAPRSYGLTARYKY